MKSLLALLALVSFSAFAQQTAITDAHKKEICELTVKKLEASFTVDSCLKSAKFELWCGDWCMHRMSNGDISFYDENANGKSTYWGSVMINRNDNLDKDSFYVRKVSK